MIRMLIALTAGLGVLLAYTAPSEACGVKLTVKSPNVKKQASAQSSNPSRILLVGSPPRRLARNLSNAGHRVEVAEDPDSADRRSYPIVMADQEHLDESNERFPNATVVPRTGSTNQNVSRIEDSLQRSPRAASGQRRPDSAGSAGPREPIASGTEEEASGASGPLASGDEPARAGGGETEEEEPQPEREEPTRAEMESEREQDREQDREREQQEADSEPEPEPERVATRDEERAEAEREPDQQLERQRSPEPEPSPDTGGADAEFNDEISFASSSARLSQDSRRAMRATAAWLRENPGVSIIVEGHTNTPGNAEYNMQLSKQRAERTRKFLVSQGVDGSRIEVEFYGQERPAYGEGIDGRNRRVVIER